MSPFTFSKKQQHQVLTDAFTKMGVRRVKLALVAFDDHHGNMSSWNSCFLAQAGYSSRTANLALGSTAVQLIVAMFDAPDRDHTPVIYHQWSTSLKEAAELWLLAKMSPKARAAYFQERSAKLLTAAARQRLDALETESPLLKAHLAAAAEETTIAGQALFDAATALLAGDHVAHTPLTECVS